MINTPNSPNAFQKTERFANTLMAPSKWCFNAFSAVREPIIPNNRAAKIGVICKRIFSLIAALFIIIPCAIPGLLGLIIKRIIKQKTANSKPDNTPSPPPPLITPANPVDDAVKAEETDNLIHNLLAQDLRDQELADDQGQLLAEKLQAEEDKQVIPVKVDKQNVPNNTVSNGNNPLINKFKERFTVEHDNQRTIEKLDYQNPNNPNIALFICGRSDSVGALRVDDCAKLNLVTLSEGYSTQFRRAGGTREFLACLQACPNDSIGNLWLSVHANSSQLTWGEPTNDDYRLTTNNSLAFEDELRNAFTQKLTPGANIFLEACSAGGSCDNGERNIAHYIADLARGHEVFASKINLSKNGNNSSEIIVDSIFPLQCQVIQNNIDQTYRVYVD